MRLQQLIVSLVLLVTTFGICSRTFAQSSDASSSGTGSTKTPEELHAERVALRTLRTKGLREAAITFQKKEEVYRKALASFLQKIAALQTNCRSDFRRANRDQKFLVQKRCYRGELSLQKEILRKQRDFIAEVPGQTDASRKAGLTQIDALNEALTALINGLDSDVFTSITQILEARKNLLTKYRVPTWNMVTLLRAERLLAWTMRLLLDIDAKVQQLTASGSVITDHWGAARSCLEEDEAKLLALWSSMSPKDELKALYAHAQTCAALLHLARNPVVGSGTTK